MKQGCRSIFVMVLTWLVSLVPQGCGGGSSAAPPPPPPQLATSQVRTGCGETIVLAKSQLNGGPLTGFCTAWALTAGNALMQFTVAATGSWLTVSPTFGTLPAGQSTGIGLLSIDATSLPNTVNRGGFTVSAPGYQDNTVIAVELDCTLTDLKGNTLCKVYLGSSVP